MDGLELAVEVVGIRSVKNFEGFGEEGKARVVLERIDEIGEPIISHHYHIGDQKTLIVIHRDRGIRKGGDERVFFFFFFEVTVTGCVVHNLNLIQTFLSEEKHSNMWFINKGLGLKKGGQKRLS